MSLHHIVCLTCVEEPEVIRVGKRQRVEVRSSNGSSQINSPHLLDGRERNGIEISSSVNSESNSAVLSSSQSIIDSSQSDSYKGIVEEVKNHNLVKPDDTKIDVSNGIQLEREATEFLTQDNAEPQRKNIKVESFMKHFEIEEEK